MKKEQNSDSLILNSTSMFFRVENELKKYNKISLFLDNDSNGKSVTAKMLSQYKNVEDCSLIYNGFKDLNGWYCE
ncbi:toprim domain-containing protein [Chryseobacterium oryzae]|uniref:Toprim domain-containing protein n=1 Tax=Chryseobacterium oryzae TaxID=2929799 RepID=A0ABY4BK25_9FLAO|nr:toprim domain-containing protein [Chryseobacterium oryzae]UOE39420.1 toprim domain-containing protein [Chryseobacterium oryzae]